MKKRFNRRQFLELSAGVTVAAVGLGPPTAHAQSAVSTSISLNGSGSGRIFDGIGAISGGGGNSRLLIDYPEPYRSQILDYLFKPGYGANLHILKVEVGGDTNSTDGSESSFMHTPTDTNFNRGYEWWLMSQAKARNPTIKLYGLAWGAPGWIGTTGATVWDTNNLFWSQDMVNYYIAWIQGAKSHYNLTIDYIGGWNEKGYNQQFFEALHNAIRSNGLSTKVVGADSGWDVADAMVSNSALNASIDIVGVHYPCTGGDGGSATSCPNTTNAKNLGKPLWASENGSQDENSGAIPMARAINRGYIDGLMTAYFNWPLIAAIYLNLPYNTVGLMAANQPWSGNYSVGKQTWVTAHTTQFTQPGWQYLDGACGYLGGNTNNGSYVTLKSTNGSDYSIIIETVDATTSQMASFQVSNGLSTGIVHVWTSDLNSGNSSNSFVQQTSITPSGGTYSLTLQPGFIYTLSTTTGQGKGTIFGPPAVALSLPYSDTFQSYSIGQEARYFSDQNGAFEIATAGGGRSGLVMRQMAPIAPHNWEDASDPYTLFGDVTWSNYTVTCDVLLEQVGYVEILGRIGTIQRSPANINAYYLRVTNGGAWSILKNSISGTLTTLNTGNVASIGINTWHTLALTFQGNTITAKIDGTTVGTASDANYSTGQVGLGVSGWQNAQFANFSVTAASSANTGTYYNLVNVNSGLLLDVTGAATAAGGFIVQSTSTGATSQQWQLVTASSGYYTLVNRNSGLVLDNPGFSTSTGTQLEQWTGTGGANQQWQFIGNNGSYTIVNKNSGLLVDVSGASTASGAPVIQWTRTGGTNQQWQLVAVPTAGMTYELVNRHSGLVMDVNAGSTSNGGTIIQYPNHAGSNQLWQFVDAGGGYFTLINGNSSLALEVPGFSTATTTQLDQWGQNGGANQQWWFTSVAGGYYTITNRNSGQLVTVSGASTASIAAIIQEPANNGSEQQWSLSLVS
ncbi:MAG: RICIN domain-containing protein [Ktedonobacteraceae bacterium]|nr:RICIN domain-containing protein [Ktedonobacteraceae bacterium]